MTTAPVLKREEDQRITLHGVSWDQFEMILSVRGDNPGVRVTYLEGELELMSPSCDHEWIKKVLARLVEAYAMEKGLDLDGYGSWTLRQAVRDAGAEPDECYILGPMVRDRPDLAIEVIWTSGGLDKLEVYARLEVPEVWFWQDGAISVHLLGPTGYVDSRQSRIFPDLDIQKLASFVDRPRQSRSVTDFLAWLRQGK